MPDDEVPFSRIPKLRDINKSTAYATVYLYREKTSFKFNVKGPSKTYVTVRGGRG